MRNRKTCVLIFLKSPRAGYVKTRLARSVGRVRSAEIYRAFIEDELEWIARFPCGERRVCFDPPDALSECLRLTPPGSQRRFRLLPQSAGDLGERMAGAFSAALGAGFGAVVAVGTDAPLLGPRLLRRAFDGLRKNDVVLGPARDGGYYLLGLRRDSPRLFAAMPWSTGSVLGATLRRAREEGLTTALLPVIGDVDTRRDLEDLRGELLEAWRAPGKDPFPLRTFRALAWVRGGTPRGYLRIAGTGRGGRRAHGKGTGRASPR